MQDELSITWPQVESLPALRYTSSQPEKCSIVLAAEEAIIFDSGGRVLFRIGRGIANIDIELAPGQGAQFQPLQAETSGTVLRIAKWENSLFKLAFNVRDPARRFLLSTTDGLKVAEWLDATPTELRQPDEADYRNQLRRVLKQAIRQRGIILLLLGLLPLFFSGFFDRYWGMLLLVVGVICLIFTHRIMFLVTGIAVIFAGVWNIILAGMASGSWIWIGFGVLQIILGLSETAHYGQFKHA